MNWKQIGEMVFLASLIGALTGLSDYLSACSTGWCHAVAPIAGSAIGGALVYLRGLYQPPPKT